MKFYLLQLEQEVIPVREHKYHLVLDDWERRIIICCLNNLRSKQIAEGKYTDLVDETLIKIIKAKKKMIKIV